MGGIKLMRIIKIFSYEESPYRPGKKVVTVNHDKFHLNGTKGSYNIIQARVMGLSYAQYLRMCRDIYGAEIIGKKSMYPVAYFTNTNAVEELVKQLNLRATLILTKRGN
jgi:hypothetical protein